MYLLDTDILIDVQRGYLPAIAWFSSLTEIPSVPGFVIMELIQGTGNSQQLRNLLKLVEPLPIIWPNETDFARALSDFTAYHLSHNLGLLDALIGACALGQNATLCTFNVKHYQAISGLQITQPYLRS
ncbi:PIN domain-containing protein [Planktothrix paucivesiculata]|uniref:PilT protein domain protein n=1 Tax=Planktothrix paucivesiculata PCC 9631 TaxID=671071 RepID=A0A7Z9E328_9CYAN|nr:PIN domain-containing protein [Planktothrix paucivesiculata]VXD22932.1 PilT protein domain protein [Planktothrix paucivesiculata PCC 9631]